MCEYTKQKHYISTLLYAKRNIEKNNVRIYIFLLNDLITKKNSNAIPLFSSLYRDTKNIVNKSISFYKIENRDFVPIVAYLSNKHPDYFRDVDTENLKDEDYTQLKSYLEEAVSSI